jgi:polyhydroxybutyrate depolymerase
MKNSIRTTFYFTALLFCKFTYAQGNTLILNQTISIGNVTREYHLFLPDTTTNAPIVILLHGHSGSHNELLGLNSNGVNDPSIVAPYREWLHLAQLNNVILIVPNGYNIGDTIKGWNDCRADGVGNSEQNDVLFISTLIDNIVNTYQANANRVYANGTSNGGHFCIRLAEEIPEKITAFAAIVSSNAVNSECATGTLPVSAMFMNGTSDPLCPYKGGQMAGNRGVFYC